MGTLAENRDARRRYHILEILEAGLALTGHETKSARSGNVSLKGSFVVFRETSPVLVNAHIGSFQPKNAPKGYDPLRTRPILLTKQEIQRLLGKRASEGLTLVPLRLYTKARRLKLEVGLARSKTKADQREAIKAREAERDIRRVLRGKV